MSLVFMSKPKGWYQGKISRVMMYKTWFAHIAYSIVKLLNWVGGMSHWLNVPKPPCDSLD